MALKKLGKTSTPGVYKWKIELSTPLKRIHTHVELTEVQAQKMYTELLETRERAKVGLPFTAPVGAHTLGEAAAKYENDLLVSEYNSVHVNQVAFSLRILRDVLKDEFPIASVNREHVRLWRDRRLVTIDERKKTAKAPGPRTINRGLAHLSAFFAWCCTEGWMENNPAQYTARVKEATPPLKILRWSDYIKFVDAVWSVRPDVAVAVEVMAETGARVSEVLEAKASDVDVGKKVWKKLVKPGRYVEIDAEEWVLTLAQMKRPKGSKYLCPRDDGEQLGYHTLEWYFKTISEELKMKITPHYLRHGRACWDLAEGKSVWQVKTKLAHTSIQTTERYLRAAELIRREEPPGTIHKRPVCVRICEKNGTFQYFPTPSNPSQHKPEKAVKRSKKKDL